MGDGGERVIESPRLQAAWKRVVEAQAACGELATAAEELAAAEMPAEADADVACVVVGRHAVYFHRGGGGVRASLGSPPLVVEGGGI